MPRRRRGVSGAVEAVDGLLLLLLLKLNLNKLPDALDPLLPPPPLLLPVALPVDCIVIVFEAADVVDASSLFLPPPDFFFSGSNLEEVSASSPSVDGVSGVVGVAISAAFGVSATRSILPAESSAEAADAARGLSPPHRGVG